MLDSVRIVLVQTSHPGNIGAAARAMKNMGLKQLYLVEPKVFPSDEATARAAGASDILDNAIVTTNLKEAIADCHLVFGTRSRDNTLPWPTVDVREAAELIKNNTKQTNIAILFGQERCGLLNEELEQCNYHVQIPANAEYPSLNLAQAVQIVTYELYMCAQQRNTKELQNNTEAYAIPATAGEMDSFFSHLEQTLIDIKFLDPSAPRKLLPRLRGLYNRAKLDQKEVNMLRGILTAIEKSIHG